LLTRIQLRLEEMPGEQSKLSGTRKNLSKTNFFLWLKNTKKQSKKSWKDCVLVYWTYFKINFWITLLTQRQSYSSTRWRVIITDILVNSNKEKRERQLSIAHKILINKLKKKLRSSRQPIQLDLDSPWTTAFSIMKLWALQNLHVNWPSKLSTQQFKIWIHLKKRSTETQLP